MVIQKKRLELILLHSIKFYSCLHSLKGFQVLLFNTNNSIQSVFHLQTAKWFQVLLYNTNTQLNGETVLFNLLMGPYQVLRLWIKVGLGVMATIGYFTFSKL